MTLTNNFNQIKTELSSFLLSCNLNNNQINEILSDEFINGILDLCQQEPSGDEFIALIRNFSSEEDLYSINSMQKEFQYQLTTDSYFTRVIQYTIDSLKEIDISSIETRISSSDDSSINSENVKKARIGVGLGLTVLKASASVKAIAGQLGIYTQLAVGTYEQEQKIQNILNTMDAELWAVATGAREAFTTAHEQASPLALDLDGDGVETTTVESGVYFDFAEKSGWVGKDDGLLVRDINNNGLIDDGTELFGNNSVLSSGEKAANGFEALADLDSNSDGVFNSSDTAWNQVKVWKDANQNGEVDSGELLTLEQAGVSGINLNYENETTTDENGNQHKQTGTFIKTDGTTGSVHDVWFDADYANTIDTTDVEISDTIAA